MQQNPSDKVNLGNWYSYFSQSMGDFSPYDSHPTVYSIIWGNAWTSSSISHSTGKCNKTHRRGEPGKLVLILFPYYGHFSSIRFRFYGILHHKGNGKRQPNPSNGESLRNWFPEISYKTHCMWRTWETGTHTFPIAWENAVKSIELGEPRKLVPIFSLTYGYFSSIRFPFYGILCYHMGNAWFFPSKSTL